MHGIEFVCKLNFYKHDVCAFSVNITLLFVETENKKKIRGMFKDCYQEIFNVVI